MVITMNKPSVNIPVWHCSLVYLRCQFRHNGGLPTLQCMYTSVDWGHFITASVKNSCRQLQPLVFSIKDSRCTKWPTGIVCRPSKTNILALNFFDSKTYQQNYRYACIENNYHRLILSPERQNKYKDLTCYIR